MMGLTSLTTPLLLLLLFLLHHPYFTNSQQNSPPPSISSLLSTAATLHNEEKLEEALEYYDEVLSLNPSNADALHLKGLLKFAWGDSEAAIDLIELAIENGGDMAIQGGNLGEVYRKAGRMEDAERVLRRATELSADRFGAWYNLGQVYWEMRRLKEAVSCFER